MPGKTVKPAASMFGIDEGNGAPTPTEVMTPCSTRTKPGVNHIWPVNILALVITKLMLTS
jgi:hypothetical protein